MSTRNGSLPRISSLWLSREVIAAASLFLLAAGAATQAQTVTYTVLHSFTLSDGVRSKNSNEGQFVCQECDLCAN